MGEKVCVEISIDLAGRIEKALNLCIGMASVHAKDSLPEIIDIAGQFADAINEFEDELYGDD